MPRRRETTRRAAPQRAPANEQAARHSFTRRAHATETAEDYAETIADLIKSGGEARVVDLARCLGVSHVTVIRTLSRLQSEGLVTTRPHRSIFLTRSGKALAARAKRRHEIVVRFLVALGVSPDTARTDAEGLEHHVSEETLRALERFADRSA